MFLNIIPCCTLHHACIFTIYSNQKSSPEDSFETYLCRMQSYSCEYILLLKQLYTEESSRDCVHPGMKLKLNALATGIICLVWGDHQQMLLLLLGAIKRNVTLHSKWWNMTYGIKASLKVHLLQSRLCFSGDFQAEKGYSKNAKGYVLFSLFLSR